MEHMGKLKLSTQITLLNVLHVVDQKHPEPMSQ